MASYLRLRQICLVASDLERVVDDLAAVFALEVCHRDPNVAKYGLVNALLPVGTSFLEVVSPTRSDTAAGRYLQRRGGDAGYMVICDCDENGSFRARASRLGIRAIEDRTYPGKADLLQLHPRDTGGCILEFDHHVGGEDLMGAYQWAGEDWQSHIRAERVTGIAGVGMQSASPDALAERWSAIFDRPVSEGLAITLDNARITFEPGSADVLATVHLTIRDRASLLRAAEARRLPISSDGCGITICGTEFRFTA